ncbi:MAG: OmpA family protein [Campylobacterales bacterium]|nr:OmpA family protein [Campylobacterales bacterium]
MFWALGLMKYADSYENPVECNQKKLAIHFDYDSYVVKTVPTTLDLIAKKNIESIVVNGHTDKCGTNEYNFALGLKRAKEVKQLLVDYSFDEKLIKTISYGESNPISSNDASNRRVDLNIKYKNN